MTKLKCNACTKRESWSSSSAFKKLVCCFFSYQSLTFLTLRVWWAASGQHSCIAEVNVFLSCRQLPAHFYPASTSAYLLVLVLWKFFSSCVIEHLLAKEGLPGNCSSVEGKVSAYSETTGGATLQNRDQYKV